MSSILIIDDDGQFREMMEEMLSRAGYRVTAAADVARGLRAMAKEPADLVITDLIMPDKDGLEAIMEIKKRHPGCPVVAISGGGRLSAQDYLPMAHTLGAARTLSKPFKREDLLRAVREVLGGS